MAGKESVGHGGMSLKKSSFGSSAISKEIRSFASPPRSGFAFVVMFSQESLRENPFPQPNSSQGIWLVSPLSGSNLRNLVNADFRQQDVSPKHHLKEWVVPKLNTRPLMSISHNRECLSSTARSLLRKGLRRKSPERYSITLGAGESSMTGVWPPRRTLLPSKRFL